MASKTSASVGMMVSLSIFALLSLVLFVLTVIFAARTQALQKERDTAVSDLNVAVRSSERNDRWEELKREASSSGMGVVAYLDKGLRDTLRLAGANRNDSAEGFSKRIGEREGFAPTLLGTVDRRDQEINDLKRDLGAAERDRDTALSDMKASSERVELIEKEASATIEKLNAQIDAYKAELDRYRDGVETTQRDMLDSSAKVRADADKTIADLESRLKANIDRVLVLEQLLDNYRGATQKNRLSPQDEATLVDARVVGLNQAAGEVYLDIGRGNNVVIGMSFEVFNLGTSIKPDADGNYPAGKASLEVIRIDETSCVARITRQSKGNPVIVGDIVANAIYDPSKKYVFTVYGSFDTNSDGIATPGEASEIRALVDRWGGTVRDDVGGDTDFLILGARPVLPPEPRATDPIEVIERFLRMKQGVQRYDDLFDTARRTGIPVLNQNRFETLTGLHGQR